MRVSIIMPAYNEEKRIGRTLEECGKFFKDLKNKKILDFEILVVLNGCKDKTEEIVKKTTKNYKEIKYLNFKRAGKGFAIIEGFKDALKKDFDLIGFVDADMSTSPEAFYDLIKNINGHDGIIASRAKKGAIARMTFLRKITHRGFNFLVRSFFLLPYKDSQCGAKLFKRSVIKTVVADLGITKWAFDVDLLYKIKRKGFKIKEIPTIWEDRRESKLSLIKVPFQMFSAIIRLRILNSPFKNLVKIYNQFTSQRLVTKNIIA